MAADLPQSRRIDPQPVEEYCRLLERFFETYHGGIPAGLNPLGMGTYREDGTPAPGVDGGADAGVLTAYGVAVAQAVIARVLAGRPVRKER